jgi:hypothetical protein
MSPDVHSSPTLHKPFIIEIRQDRRQPNGSFIPAASLKLTEYFRTSGLLASLAPEDLKNLLYLLTFLSPEGQCQVSLPILASAMKVSSQRTKTRMRRLAEAGWQGEPLILETPHESGLCIYSLHPLLVAYEHLTVSEPYPTPPFRAASREQIIAYSRQHYARPRDEVEKMVAQQLGHDMDEPEELRKLRYRLESAGLTTDQAREIMSMYDADLIAQQLDWLPYRHAKNPAGYLLAAIEGHYDEPRAVRQERLLKELHYQEQLLRQEYEQQHTPDQPDLEQPQGEGPRSEGTGNATTEAQMPDHQQPGLDDAGEERDEPDEPQPQSPAEWVPPGAVDPGTLGEDETVSLTPDG